MDQILKSLEFELRESNLWQKFGKNRMYVSLYVHYTLDIQTGGGVRDVTKKIEGYYNIDTDSSTITRFDVKENKKFNADIKKNAFEKIKSIGKEKYEEKIKKCGEDPIYSVPEAKLINFVSSVTNLDNDEAKKMIQQKLSDYIH